MRKAFSISQKPKLTLGKKSVAIGVISEKYKQEMKASKENKSLTKSKPKERKRISSDSILRVSISKMRSRFLQPTQDPIKPPQQYNEKR